MELRKGMLVISKAGHDKECWYVVLNIENRSVDRPKEKKLKHLQPVKQVPEILQEKLRTGKPWTNEEIKRALKLAVQD